ncbi:MAG TPA: AMP-binding protein [Armatimonadota bacterium]|jgi:acetyl-CoA synthetase
MFTKYVTQSTFTSYEDFKENFRIHVPESFNFAYDVVDEYALTQPGKIALVWCDEHGREATFTFAEMKRYSDKVANILRDRGIGKGDPVMLILKRRYEYWFCLIALHKLGALAIPATHLLTKKDLIYRCNAAKIKMIIAVDEERVLDEVDAAQVASPTLQHKIVLHGEREGWLALDGAVDAATANFVRLPEDATVNADPMLLYFTSGTTGMPKMVVHNYAYPLGHILTAKYWQNVQENGLHLTVADTGWAKAAWGKIYGQWLCGSAVFVYDYERFHPNELLDVIVKHRITTFCAPPTIYRFFIKEDLTQYDLSSIKYCVVAGEPLNPEVYTAFLRGTGLKLMEAYGQTEMTVSLATYPWVTPKPGSMGKPSPGYAIDLLNDNGESCEVGEEGQIIIRTSEEMPTGLFCGYHDDEALTSSVWHDGVYYTGDMAWRDEDGYYWFVGRADDLIKTSGYRVGPFEVESALIEHPAVMECAVTGVPDPTRGHAIKATIVLAKGYVASDELAKELQNYVKKVTAPYKYPRIVEFVTELPKTISGKIRRVEIREGDEKPAVTA